MSHHLKQPWRAQLKGLSPFGLGHPDKPKHYRAAIEALAGSRDNLRYALKVLNRGVCESCALGVAGLHDWTIGEPHFCLKRLADLRLHTMPAVNHKMLAGVSDVSLMTDAELRKLGRLGHPMRRRYAEPGFTRISWEDAYQRIADHIREREPDRLAFHLSARGLSNETYYIAQKVARFFGTNNIDTAGRLTRCPSRAALRAAVGVGEATCSYRDMWGTDLVVLFGGEPARDYPVITNYLHHARRSGAKVVSVVSELEPEMRRYWVPSIPMPALIGSQMSDYWFPVRTRGMSAFLYGVIRVLHEQGWCDEAFIDTFTAGYDELIRQAEAVDWPTLEEHAGVDRAAMAELAELIGKAQKAVFVWPVGSAAHAPDAPATALIVSLALTRGFVGRRRCGLIPIPIDSSRTGAAAMGAVANAFPANRPANAQLARYMSAHWNFPVPHKPGLDAAGMIDAIRHDRLSMLYCVGGNMDVYGVSDEQVRHAMERVPLRVHQDAILTEQMFIEPKREDGEVLLLPAKSIYEQRDGATFTSAERRVMFHPEMPREVGETLSHWRIFLQLADTVHPNTAGRLECDSGEAIRHEIARVVPEYHGIQYLEKVGDAFQSGGPRLCEDWHFQTADGKARFLAPTLRRASTTGGPDSTDATNEVPTPSTEGGDGVEV